MVKSVIHNSLHSSKLYLIVIYILSLLSYAEIGIFNNSSGNLISFGITILPKSSTLRIIPVIFIRSLFLSVHSFQNNFCICIGSTICNIIVFIIIIYIIRIIVKCSIDSNKTTSSFAV